MSITAVAASFGIPVETTVERAVLGCVASFALPDGTGASPPVEVIAARTGYGHVALIEETLHALVCRGVLTAEPNPDPGGPTVYGLRPLVLV